MNFRVLTLIVFVFFCFNVFAGNEVVFGNLGYDSVVFDSMEEKCIEIDFLSDVNSFELVSVLSLYFDFFGIQNDSAKIKVFFNDFLLNEFTAIELDSVIVEENSFFGWKRFFVPVDLINEKNLLKICVKASNSIPRITFLNESVFGFYSMPLFKENSFEMILTEEPIAGKDIPVEIILRNYGSVSQEVNVVYRKNELEHRTPWVKFVSGKSTFSGEVPACIEWSQKKCIVPGKRTFSYLIRINKVGELSLLPAILNYETFFNEKITGKESNRLYLNVLAPEVKLTPFFIVPDSTFFIGEEIPLKLIIKNTGLVNTPKINVEVTANELNLSSTFFNSFELNAGELKEFDLIAFSSSEGEFFVNCIAVIPDYELIFNCEKTSIVFEEPEFPLELIIGAFFVLIALIVLIYFYFKKSSI